MVVVEKILSKDKPDVVLVEGDTNTMLAGTLATTKLHIKLGHVEEGLEVNRILTDHCSHYLFAPTAKTKKIPAHEGIPLDKIFVTSNKIVDAV